MKESTRQKKFSRLVQREIGEILLQDRKGILNHKLVSVVQVKMSPDLAIAKIYLSMLLEKDKEGTLENINNRKSEIRKILGNKIGKQVRVIPELLFFIDIVEEEANRIESLIDSLEIPPEPEE